MPTLEPAAIERLISGGTATAGMIAKLRACEHALAHGVGDVVIVDGRDGAALEAAALDDGAADTRRGCVRDGGRQARRLNGRRQRWSEARERVMTTVMDDIQALEARHVLQTYRRQPVTLVRGEGVRLFDADGREYLDLLSGIGVASLGHAHPGLARGDRRSGADAAAHVESVLPPAAGAAGRAAGAICRGCRARFSATAAPKRSKRA